jgi:hypothetical protein
MKDIAESAAQQNPRTARNQQSIRLYDAHKAIVDEWAEILSPEIPLDRSAVIRKVLEFSRELMPRYRR